MTARCILVPLDGSAHARGALPVATALAALLEATLEVVHVAPAASSPSQLLERVGLSAEEARGWVLEARAGEPSAQILAAACESPSALIVMCTHTAEQSFDKTVGRTALAVIKAAPCPLVLVHPRRGAEPWGLRRILLPHDGTPTTSAAIGPAAELARRANAELLVLHVVAPVGAGVGAEQGSVTAPRYMDQPQHEWPAWGQEFLDRLSCLCPLESLRVRISLARGDPGPESSRFAAEHAADLIVLAWKGDWAGEHARTAKSIIRRAVCPVMLIRAED